MIAHLVTTIVVLVAVATGAAVAGRLQDRADRRRQLREWDATVKATTGMAWNPITRHYEKPPGTLPWTPARPRLLRLGDIVTVALVLYASWRLRKGGRRG